MTELPIYGQLDAIVARLRAQDKADWADRVEGAILAGFTGGEILMAVRWELRQLLSVKGGVDGALRQDVETAIRWINEALPTSPDPGPPHTSR